jgi:SAM-dependent methyltransferase
MSSEPAAQHEGSPRLVCPQCRCEIVASGDSAECRYCERKYPVEGRVVRFVDRDEFYEGAYDGTINYLPATGPLSELGLYLINTHYLWWFRRFVSPGSRVLELGCGGGVRYFARHARVTALDLSLASLRKLDAAYELAIQGDAQHLPLADAQYDAVVSAYFWEHVGDTQRDRILSEIRRVLKPGGTILFLFDVASWNPLFAWLRKDAAMFQQCFVEHDHHYGLETATHNIQRFERNGFRVLASHLANKTPVQHLPVYSWARPYDRPLTTMLARAGQAVGSRPFAAKLYSAALTLADDLLEPLLPADWARIMLVALRRH